MMSLFPIPWGMSFADSEQPPPPPRPRRRFAKPDPDEERPEEPIIDYRDDEDYYNVRPSRSRDPVEPRGNSASRAAPPSRSRSRRSDVRQKSRKVRSQSKKPRRRAYDPEYTTEDSIDSEMREKPRFCHKKKASLGRSSLKPRTKQVEPESDLSRDSKTEARESISPEDMTQYLKRKEQKEFERCEELFLPLIKRWRRAVKDEDVESIEEVISYILREVDSFSSSFIESNGLPQLMKESKVILEYDGADLSVYETLWRDMWYTYTTKAKSVPADFKPAKSNKQPKFDESRLPPGNVIEVHNSRIVRPSGSSESSKSSQESWSKKKGRESLGPIESLSQDTAPEENTKDTSELSMSNKHSNSKNRDGYSSNRAGPPLPERESSTPMKSYKLPLQRPVSPTQSSFFMPTQPVSPLSSLLRRPISPKLGSPISLPVERFVSPSAERSAGCPSLPPMPIRVSSIEKGQQLAQQANPIESGNHNATGVFGTQNPQGSQNHGPNQEKGDWNDSDVSSLGYNSTSSHFRRVQPMQMESNRPVDGNDAGVNSSNHVRITNNMKQLPQAEQKMILQNRTPNSPELNALTYNRPREEMHMQNKNSEVDIAMMASDIKSTSIHSGTSRLIGASNHSRPLRLNSSLKQSRQSEAAEVNVGVMNERQAAQILASLPKGITQREEAQILASWGYNSPDRRCRSHHFRTSERNEKEMASTGRNYHSYHQRNVGEVDGTLKFNSESSVASKGKMDLYLANSRHSRKLDVISHDHDQPIVGVQTLVDATKITNEASPAGPAIGQYDQTPATGSYEYNRRSPYLSDVPVQKNLVKDLVNFFGFPGEKTMPTRTENNHTQGVRDQREDRAKREIDLVRYNSQNRNEVIHESRKIPPRFRHTEKNKGADIGLTTNALASDPLSISSVAGASYNNDTLDWNDNGYNLDVVDDDSKRDGILSAGSIAALAGNGSFVENDTLDGNLGGLASYSYLTDERGVDDYSLASMEQSLRTSEITLNSARAVVRAKDHHKNTKISESSEQQENLETLLSRKVSEYEEALGQMTELRTRAEIQSEAGVESHRLDETKKLLLLSIKKVTDLQEELEGIMKQNKNNVA